MGNSASGSLRFGVSYFGVRNPRHVVEDLKVIKDSGFDFVVHTFSENDADFYRDTMREIVDLTHKFGMEAYIDPWGVAGIFGGEAYSKFVARNHDVLQIYNDGNSAAAACPNNPRTLEFVKEWIDMAAEIGGDVVFFDEPHFAYSTGDRWACTCEHCKEKFRSEFGRKMPTEFDEDVNKFRLMSIKDFLRELAAYAKSKGLKTAVCMLPRESELELWEEIFGIPEIDIVGTDPYWTVKSLHGRKVYKHVFYFTKKVVEIAGRFGKEPQIWVQAFKIKRGDEEDIKLAVKAAVDGGARNVAVWSYLATGYMSYIKCERPEVAWGKLIEAIDEAKSQVVESQEQTV